MSLSLNLPDWPRLMTRETAAAYLDGLPMLRLLEERGLQPVARGAKLLRFDRAAIDAHVSALAAEGAPLPPASR